MHTAAFLPRDAMLAQHMLLLCVHLSVHLKLTQGQQQ